MAYLSHGKSLLFRFSHGARFRIAAKLINAKPGQTILDYGCADGRLLKLLRPNGVTLFAYDIAPEVQEELKAIDELKVVTDISKLDCCSCDTIALCEVLEHVLPADANKILNECKRLLKQTGKLVISVPIEVGPSVLIKSVARMAVVRPLEHEMTFKNVLRAAFYRPIERRDYGGFYFHTGFDYRTVLAQLKAAGFIHKKTKFSPIHILGPLLNSQIFFTFLPDHASS